MLIIGIVKKQFQKFSKIEQKEKEGVTSMDNINSLSFILHVSDFHLTDGKNEFASEALKVLSEKLKLEGIKIDYLLHTGDVIDSSDIYEKTAASLACCKDFYKNSGAGEEAPKKFDFSLFETKAPKEDKQAFNKQLEDFVRERFANAVSVIQSFISALNISPGNVVICCGNHDVLRPLNIDGAEVKCEKINNEEKECWEYKNSDKVKDIFSPFEWFLDQLKTANSQTRCGTKEIVTHCTLNNLNIILLNTSWKNPKDITPGYFCARCDQFEPLISHLNQNKSKSANTINIVMAHKPIYEICEKARLSYQRYMKTPFMSALQEFINGSGIYLCGDKHTRSIFGSRFHDIPHYIGGEPLTIRNRETGSFEVEYNLLEIGDCRPGIERKIHLKSEDGQKWVCDLRPQDTIVSDLYDASKDFLVKNVLETIATPKTLHTWENLCQEIYRWHKPEKVLWYTNLDKLYKAICKYRECGRKERPWNEENIFSFVCGRLKGQISTENFGNILNIRGENSSGKSTFLGLLYIYLLYQYSIGLIDFIPAYFNLENQEVLKKIQDGISYHEAAKQIFEDFAKKIKDIAMREHQSVCYIIDGLDEQDCWSFSSEDSIGRGILDVLSKCEKSYYIMSFSQHHLPYFKNTMPPRTYSDSSDIVYFNPIAIQEKGSEDTRFISFVNAFVQLKNFPGRKTNNVEHVSLSEECLEPQYELIRNFRRLIVNPGFMYHNYNYIMDAKEHHGKSVDDIYDYYIGRQHEMCLQKLGYGFIHYAPAMAFFFSYKGYTYEKFKHLQEDYTLREHHIFKLICENREKVYDAFLFIKKQTDASEYLIALHYNRELRYYAEHPGEPIEQGSILNDFIARNVAVLIRKLWSDTNKFMIVCEKLLQRNELSNCLQSMLIYCLAHLKMYAPFQDRLHKELNIKATSTLQKQQSNATGGQSTTNEWLIDGDDNDQKLECFMNLSLKHTMKIFEFMGTNNSVKLVKVLLADRAFCSYNRQYQMLYYGDLSVRGEDKRRPLNPGNDIVYKGFDFHNTFNYLYVKLASDDAYPLREFDMFTMWDLIRSRLSTEHLQKSLRPEGKPDTFFYWDSLREKADKVLMQAYIIFDTYLKKFSKNKETKDNTLPDEIFKYFSIVRDFLKDIINERKKAILDADKAKQMLRKFDREVEKTSSQKKQTTKTK